MKQSRHGRKVGYALAGVSIGAIVYLLLQSDIPQNIDAKTSLSQFHEVTESYETDEIDYNHLEDVEPFLKYGSYHVTQSKLNDYIKNETVRYSKANPTFYLEIIPPKKDEVEAESSLETPNETTAQQSAVQKAKEYLKVLNFSRQGLIEQLVFEGFSVEDSTYGADNSGADWKQQAEEKAKSYMNLFNYSHSGLVDQLKFEGFTEEQALHGANTAYKIDSIGGAPSETVNSVLEGFNTETREFESVNVDFIRKQFKFAQLPLDIEHYRSSSNYGIRIDPFQKVKAFHTGLDLATDSIDGANIYSVLSGMVVEAVEGAEAYGNYVVIRHNGFETMYAHMKEAPLLEVGDWVEQGDIIGYVGSTGRSTGPHLHFEVKIDNLRLDPIEFLREVVRYD